MKLWTSAWSLKVYSEFVSFCLIRKLKQSHLFILGSGMFEAYECLKIKSETRDHRKAWKNSNSPVIRNSFVNTVPLYSKTLRKQKQNNFYWVYYMINWFTVIVENIDWAFIMYQHCSQSFLYISVYLIRTKIFMGKYY